MLRVVFGVSQRTRISRCCTVLALLGASSSPQLWTSALLVSGTTFHNTPTQCGTTTDSARLYSSTTIDNNDMPTTLEVAQFGCLNDNYGYLLHDPATGATAAVDTPEAKPIREQLKSRGWKLTHILNTHHHWDHTGGNAELAKTEGPLEIVGPATEKIPGRTFALQGGDEFTLGSHKVQVIDVGGHTLGHIAYYFPDARKVFVGDALFTLGCGRMFEGTPEQFWASLERLRALPDDTTVYCAHEYTAANAKFALSVEPGNAALQEQASQITALRAKGLPTVPTSIGSEKQANPFLRCDTSAELRQAVGVTAEDSPAQAFAKVRKAKDNFRG